MIGENESRQIVGLAREGASAEEISNSLGVELAAVKLVLAANNTGSALDRDINDTQLQVLRDRAYGLALQDHDINVSARMTMFLLERDKPRKSSEVNLSIQTINTAIVEANKAVAELAKEYLV